MMSKLKTDYPVFMKGASKKYWCEGCAFFLQGIGNWGGCTIVAPKIEEEKDGLHIHRKSSCKYWTIPEDSSLATSADINPNRFSKSESLYGVTDELHASPLGFSCKNCEYWLDENGCRKFDGEVNEDDCSDAWQPSDEALKSAQKHEDNKPPMDEETAKKYAEIYGPNIGEELKRALNDEEVESLIKAIRVGNEEVNRFYSLALNKGSHKYISREWKGDRWEYTYPDQSSGVHPSKNEAGEKTIHEQSQTKHATDGKYSTERLKIHKNIVSKLSNSKADQGPKAKLVATIILGPAASGKSTLVKDIGGEYQLLDSDEVKPLLHQYGDDDVAPKEEASYYHRESADVMRSMMKQSIKKRRNVVIPATFSNYEKSKVLLKKLKKKGYEINVKHVYAPLETVLERNERRYNKTGRYVPKEVVESDYDKSDKSIKRLKSEGLFDSYELKDHS